MATAGFNGLKVVSFESRMATEMTRLIERHGGKPLVAPALREIPLADNSAALQFGEKLLREGLDVLVLMTGAGTTALFEVLETRHTKSELAAALKHTVLIARGPKPVAALKSLGFQPTLTVPEPNTWMDVVSTLDAHRPVNGLRVAVQEYGVSNRDLLEALKQRGAQITPVPIYRWALPEDTAPMKEALRQILAGQVQVVLITNAAQFDHLIQLAEQEGETAMFKQACGRLVLASIGPTASERIRSHGLTVDFEPSHGKMGILVKETSEQALRLLATKRAS
ncbi:MAG: uroporphyrinogen-III synthase [Nitrospira sp.]|nr:uroporphyrinogen-III synthase [Nitrospira sp.]HMU28946.1 uroporphyrinogen-III synthase [Nitrospira sp.]HMV59427.1 uroporphyrinogen-III synthase [Nitrospira sp.]HMW87335.1 uroporphyrinogen-III synthase [Nitrospira sp.]HMZ98809.1 uroporphyrinogen-III synthase [Nitrospira sp.]